MQLTSGAFAHQSMMPAKYTCEGENISPPLSISGVPKSAKSLVLIMDDPDAPMATWDHWIVGGIEPSLSEVEENFVPGKWQAKNSWGKANYGGPCPPSGTHRYFFRLYALDCELEMDGGNTKDDVERAMVGHVLDDAELIGLYVKQG